MVDDGGFQCQQVLTFQGPFKDLGLQLFNFRVSNEFPIGDANRIRFASFQMMYVSKVFLLALTDFAYVAQQILFSSQT